MSKGNPKPYSLPEVEKKYGVFGDRIMILAKSIFYSFMGVYKP